MRFRKQTPEVRTIGEQHQLILMSRLWNLPFTANIGWEPVFHYYLERFQGSLVNAGRHSFARSHEDVISVAGLIRQGLPFETARLLVEQAYTTTIRSVSPSAVAGTLYLVARLLTMMEVGSIGYEVSGQRKVDWSTGSLHACVGDWLSRSTPTLPVDEKNVRLEKAFNAANLGSYAGVKIVWTDNLTEHLSLRNNDKEVAIFHSATFLVHHYTHILPADFRQETIDTLKLLFPQHDSNVRRCYRKWLAEYQILDPQLISCGRLSTDERRIDHFFYWRDRITILKQVFDDPDQKTLEQWLYDRRKRGQWYAFWAAIMALFLTVFFGLIQSIEGGIQVYKAYNPS